MVWCEYYIYPHATRISGFNYPFIVLPWRKCLRFADQAVDLNKSRLWGAGSVQTYYYFNVCALFIPVSSTLTLLQGFPNDDWRLKLLVGAVWCLDTLHQGFITHTCYIYLITNYANPNHLFVVVKSILVRNPFPLFLDARLVKKLKMLNPVHGDGERPHMPFRPMLPHLSCVDV